MGVKTRALTIGLVALLTLGLVACGDPAEVSVEAPLDRGPDALPDGITVAGEGEVSGAPDTLLASYSVTVKRDNVGSAVADNAVAANAVIDAAKQAGVADEDIQTQNYTVTQEFTYPDSGASPVPDGFRVTNSVTVKIRTLDTAGEVIDATIGAGGDDVRLNTVSFTLEEDGPALEAARQAAFNDAKARAQQYADLSGQGLGLTQAVSDVLVTPQAQTFRDAAAYDALAGAAATSPIEAGEVTTTVTVNARFTFS